MIYIDADACPVKNETINVGLRHKIEIFIVSNGGIRLNPSPMVHTIIVERGMDVADKWISSRVKKFDIVITNDMPLAFDVIKLGALVLTPYGKKLSSSNIGQILATRNLMHELRSIDNFMQGKGNSFSKKNRSDFLNNLEQVIRSTK